MRLRGALLACAVLALSAVEGLSASAWAAKPLPAPPRSYVHNEGVVTGTTADQVGRRLRGLEEKTGHQFVVALFQSLDGEDLEGYSNKLFKSWKIGGKKGNDGLLFLVFQQDRKWRVEVGYGLEGTITDLEAAEIVRNAAVPRFKDGDYNGGVQAAVEDLARKVEGLPPTHHAASKPEEDSSAWPWLSFLFLLCLRNPALLWIPVAVAMSLMTKQRKGKKDSLSRRGHSSSSGWGGFFGSGGSGGWSSGGGGFSSGGGFSGGGGSSGGGGASGSW